LALPKIGHLHPGQLAACRYRQCRASGWRSS
jgi:hypothetical protein